MEKVFTPVPEAVKNNRSVSPALWETKAGAQAQAQAGQVSDMRSQNKNFKRAADAVQCKGPEVKPQYKKKEYV